MKKNVMKKWVKALRSGEYHQGKGQLVDNQDNFCCLGVLCNIAPGDVRGNWSQDDCGCCWYMYGEDRVLPKKIMEWAGMSHDDGSMYMDDTNICLMELNDYGASFDEIADIIEHNWREL